MASHRRIFTFLSLSPLVRLVSTSPLPSPSSSRKSPVTHSIHAPSRLFSRAAMSSINFTPFLIVVAVVGGALLLATSALIIVFMRRRRGTPSPEPDDDKAESGQIISIMAPLRWEGDDLCSPRSRFSDTSSATESISIPEPAVTISRPPLQKTTRIDIGSPLILRRLPRYGRSDVASLPPPPSPTPFIDRPLPPVPPPSALIASPARARSLVDWSSDVIVDGVDFRFVRPPNLAEPARPSSVNPYSQIPPPPTIIRRKRSFTGIEQHLQAVGAVSRSLGSVQLYDGRNQGENFIPRTLDFATGDPAPINSHPAKLPQQYSFLELPPPQKSFLSFGTDSGSTGSASALTAPNQESRKYPTISEALPFGFIGDYNTSVPLSPLPDSLQGGSLPPEELPAVQPIDFPGTKAVVGTPEARYGVTSREQLYSRIGIAVRPLPRIPSPIYPFSETEARLKR